MEMWDCHSVSLHFHRTVKQILSGLNFYCFSEPLPASQLWIQQRIKWLLYYSLPWFCHWKDQDPVSRDVTNTIMKTPDELECSYMSWWRKLVPLCKFWQIYKHWQLPDIQLTPYLWTTLWGQMCLTFLADKFWFLYHTEKEITVDERCVAWKAICLV